MNVRDIKAEIRRLENSTPSYPVFEKLAVMYTVLNNIEGRNPEPEPVQIYASPKIATTEFGRLLMDIPIEDSLPILEEHFEAIKITYPKEYDMIMDKLMNQ